MLREHVSRRGLLLGAAAAILLLPAEALADGKRAKAKRYRLNTPGSGIDTGGAVILIEAPQDAVLKVVQNYRKYRKILPRLEQSRVLKRHRGKTDVYLRAPILHGAVSIWGVARFGQPKPWRKDGKILSGKLVKGNLDAWQGRWKMRPMGPNSTALWLEMFVDPKVPMPDAWITPELMWASDKGVTAVRDMAEGRA
jgi:ribosome-associated toxin RatA of RatAB toxin-antitoxin module